MKTYDTPTNMNFPQTIEQEEFDDAVQDLTERTEAGMSAIARTMYDLYKPFYDFITDSIYDSIREGAGYDEHYFIELADEEVKEYIDRYFMENEQVRITLPATAVPKWEQIFNELEMHETHKLVSIVCKGDNHVHTYRHWRMQ